MKLKKKNVAPKSSISGSRSGALNFQFAQISVYTAAAGHPFLNERAAEPYPLLMISE